MRLTRHLARLLRAASVVSDQCLLQQTTGAICVGATQQASNRLQPIQPGIDYAVWARQQQAWRLYAAPAREVQSSAQEVAERKLAEAHSRYQQLQDTIAGASSSAGVARQHQHVQHNCTPAVAAAAAANNSSRLSDMYNDSAATCSG
jgi:hypothetical protein